MSREIDVKVVQGPAKRPTLIIDGLHVAGPDHFNQNRIVEEWTIRGTTADRLRDRLSDALDGSEGEDRTECGKSRHSVHTDEPEGDEPSAVLPKYVVDAILAARDALVEENVNEAYHHLYQLAETYADDPFEPWAKLEDWQESYSATHADARSSETPHDAEDVRQMSDEELVEALESLAINFCLEAGFGYMPVKIHALEIKRRLTDTEDEDGF